MQVLSFNDLINRKTPWTSKGPSQNNQTILAIKWMSAIVNKQGSKDYRLSKNKNNIPVMKAKLIILIMLKLTTSTITWTIIPSDQQNCTLKRLNQIYSLAKIQIPYYHKRKKIQRATLRRIVKSIGADWVKLMDFGIKLDRVILARPREVTKRAGVIEFTKIS